MIAVQEEKNIYRANFRRLEQEGPAPLRRLREEGIARFEAIGFPTVRDEDWKFTSVAPLAKIPFQPATPPSPGELSLASLERAAFPLGDCQRLVFLNGCFMPGLSRTDRLPAGALAMGLGQALSQEPALVEKHLGRGGRHRDQAFTALNTAFVRDGAFVFVPRGVTMSEPLYILLASSCPDEGSVAHPRNLVVVDENAELRLVEYYLSLDERVGFTNAVTEIAAGAGCSIDHYKVQRESVNAFHVATTYIDQARASTFSSHFVSLGGGLVRNEVRSRLGAEACTCTLNGLYLGSGRQHIDNYTVIDHAFPNCASHELYKGILDDQAHGVFNGKIFVRQDAQKTDAKQTNQTLLLSDTAVINAKPQLEIFADDVKCTHGATIGQLDDEGLFYLRSRGIGQDEARSLLTFAFANDVVGRIKVERIRAQLEEVLLVRQHLPAFEEAS